MNDESMNTRGSAPEDEDLRTTLRDWKVDSALPPRFQEQVWRRIEQNAPIQQDGWQLIRAWAARMFVRPSFALSYATILLFAGLLAGFWQGHAEEQRENQMLRTRYVQMVDPYKMPRH